MEKNSNSENASSQKANAKFTKCSDGEFGLHPVRLIIYETQFSNPKNALNIQVRPEVNAIPGFSGIQNAEFSGYRLLCREHSSPSFNEFTLDNLRTSAQSIMDSWDPSGANLPFFVKNGRKCGFLVC